MDAGERRAALPVMRQKQIMAPTVRPVLWKTIGFERLPEVHQQMYENNHMGKIAILVGAESEDDGRNEDGPEAIRP